MSFHTGRPQYRKRAAGQFPGGTRQGAAQVVQGVGMPAWKPGAASLEDAGDVRGVQTLPQQLLGDPFIGDTPVWVWESLRDTQPDETRLIELCCRSPVYRGGPLPASVRWTAGGGGTEERACSTRLAARLAQPGCAYSSRTQGAQPLGKRRCGF